MTILFVQRAFQERSMNGNKHSVQVRKLSEPQKDHKIPEGTWLIGVLF